MESKIAQLKLSEEKISDYPQTIYDIIIAGNISLHLSLLLIIIYSFW